VLKRLMSCSHVQNPIPRPVAARTGQPDRTTSGVIPAWEHGAPDVLSEGRGWSTTEPLAEYAGWTEVVIQRGPWGLIDLPVGRSAADLTSLSWWRHATYPGGSPILTGGGTTTLFGRESGESRESRADEEDQNTCGCPGSEAMGRVSCPNHYEVTL
jgi:hypothetical protein